SDIYSKNRLTGLRISLDGNKKFPSNAIYDAIKIPRSYYMHTNNESGKSNTGENIIIIPSMKIAIYFYYY
ncbi:MAG: hypothetical protein ACKVON_08000, partial [Beijerinckiaceae bacterium]